MNQKFNLENYLSDGVDSLVKQALHATRLNPRQSAFLVKYAIASKNAAAKRAKFHKNGEHIPPFLIASITSQCNLHCAGCYARAESTCVDRTPICQLSDTEWKQVFEESAALGISFILLAGGEPLMRRDVLLEAGRLPEIFFPIFTNGTMLDEAYTRLFRQYRNLMPVLSVEGSAEITDARRGSGVFQQLVTAMELLQQNRILFGTSITVTTQTLKDVTSDAFIQMLCDKGCSVVFFVEYVPVTPDSLQLAPGDAQRQYMNARLQELRRIFSDRIFISFPGDEKATGGCVAAGRGFFHINSHGGAEPCPFSPYSDCNVRDTSVREALRSPLFRSLQDGGILMAEHDGGCILFEQKTRVEALLSQS